MSICHATEDVLMQTAPVEDDSASIHDAVRHVTDVLAPVWPLQDYVAINPFNGVSGRPFLAARQFLRCFSDVETLMPLGYYAEAFREGQFDRQAITAAIAEMRADGLECPLDADQIVADLQALPRQPIGPAAVEPPKNQERSLWTIAQSLDRQTGSRWAATIDREISKWCATHYDDGQAVWANPWRDRPLYEAWRQVAVYDRAMRCEGLHGFSKFLKDVPQTHEATIAFCLRRLGVPERLWESFLLCHAYATPGWSAWAKYHATMAERAGEESDDLAGLLAIRLVYDAALAEQYDFDLDWTSMEPDARPTGPAGSSAAEGILRYVLLRASELAFRDQLVQDLQPAATRMQTPAPAAPAPNAQMIFCIDVRSERLRRQLEASSDRIATSGFAGFFGLPLKYVRFGETAGADQVPVLLSPTFTVTERLAGIDSDQDSVTQQAAEGRGWKRLLRQAWKSMQASAVSCFAFVETSGWWFGPRLLARAAGWARPSEDGRFDGIPDSHRGHLGPTLEDLAAQGLTLDDQVTMAAGVLRNLGLIEDFAPLVIFCGHGSQTENNPLQAGLDCGACGGHTGEANARFAAMLMNAPEIRRGLAERGIHIPDTTHFIGGLHNTTTDEITLFDRHLVPASHTHNVQAVLKATEEAARRTRIERMPTLGSDGVKDLLQRAREWSEVRPEWGLAGNAAFIAAPRRLTQQANLDGRVFLHDYDAAKDAAGAVLETIMTAPMVVAHWINMQYYASAVDNRHFGSGNKTVHNVVGGFGLHSGNGGDLMTGLPWQSLHTGDTFQHRPLRLQVVIAASREAIDAVIEKHDMLDRLLTNDWLHLIAIDEGALYRCRPDRTWSPLTAPASLAGAQ